jgi:hypothetical protein
MTDRQPMACDYEERLRGYIDGDPDADPPWDGRDGMEAALAYLLRAHDYWRERSAMGPNDLRRESVTLPMVEAWLRDNGWAPMAADGSAWTSWVRLNPGGDDSAVDVPRDPNDLGVLAVAIRDAATADGLSPWRALHQIARDFGEDDEPGTAVPLARKGQASLF